MTSTDDAIELKGGMKQLELEMVRSVIVEASEGVTSFRYILLHLPTPALSTLRHAKILLLTS
jgi:hypothetical protein